MLPWHILITLYSNIHSYFIKFWYLMYKWSSICSYRYCSFRYTVQCKRAYVWTLRGYISRFFLTFFFICSIVIVLVCQFNQEIWSWGVGYCFNLIGHVFEFFRLCIIILFVTGFSSVGKLRLITTALWKVRSVCVHLFSWIKPDLTWPDIKIYICW